MRSLETVSRQLMQTRPDRICRRRAGLLFALLLWCAQNSASELFDGDDVLQLTLTGPLATVIEDELERTEHPFTLHVNGIDHDVDVRLRGNSRVRVCDFPPLRIDFGDKGKQSVFEAQDKLKLVTHCRKSRSADSAVLREYAAYKIFNRITDASYRVRLVRVTYVDTDQALKPATFERPAFFIEPEAEFSARSGLRPVHTPGVSLGSLAHDHAARVFIFQYLIGNTDWSLVTADSDERCCHNGDLFERDSKRYYVPYDFDLSGLVNARYAKPDPSLRISRVTQRLYRGYCIPSAPLIEALEDITSSRETIMDVVNGVPGFSERDRGTTVKYLERFFEQAGDSARLVRRFERQCL